MQIIKVVVHTFKSEQTSKRKIFKWDLFQFLVDHSLLRFLLLLSWFVNQLLRLSRSLHLLCARCACQILSTAVISQSDFHAIVQHGVLCDRPTIDRADRNALHIFNVMRFALLHGIMAVLVARPFPVETINISKWICGWVPQIGTDADKPKHKFMDVVGNSRIEPFNQIALLA